MYLVNFGIKDFRNFEQLKVAFDPHINVFIGHNAQGKTNLLEAIYFLGLTRSQRTSTDKELIRFGAQFANLTGQVQKSQVKVDLQVRITDKGKKAWINHLEQPKLSKYVGQLNAVLFSPEDLALVKGAPAIRRRFMDLEFGQISPDYLYFSKQYRQVLRQKNHYLKQLSSGKAKDTLFLGVLSDQLAGIGAEIIHRRYQYLTFLEQDAQQAHQAISARSEWLSIAYLSSVSSLHAKDSVEHIYQQVLASFKRNQTAEIRTGTTLSGPHRDDLQFTVNGKDAHLYASQGQQRTIALSLRLAEIELVHRLTQEYPILLLDDVMSELDHERQSAMLNYIHGKTQTFMTTTDLEGISWEMIKAPRIYHLIDGKISEEKEN